MQMTLFASAPDDGKCESLIEYGSFPKSYWKVPIDKQDWDRKYREYLRTDRWNEFRGICISKTHGRCTMCTKPASVVHHAVYPSSYFGSETDNDLVPLCKSCHYIHHHPFSEESDQLQHARDMLVTMRSEGTVCPVCDQTVREYNRPIISTMARGLMWLVAEYERTKDWIHVNSLAPKSIVNKGGAFALMEHWGLIEQKPNDDNTKRTSGYWKPTELGVEFANGRAQVPRKLLMYNNTVLKASESLTDIKRALGEKFDYSELMGVYRSREGHGS